MGRRLIALALAAIVGACGGACGGARAESETAGDRAEPETGGDRGGTITETEATAEPAPERVRVRLIFVSLESRTEESAEERARMLARTARADDFSQLAAEYGDGENAANLGAAGLMLEPDDARVPATVRDAAFALDVREVSRPLRSDDGFWVIQRVQ